MDANQHPLVVIRPMDPVSPEVAELNADARLIAALGGARQAQLPLLARESDEYFVLARIAANPREARLPDATVEVVGRGLVPRALPEAVARLEALLMNCLFWRLNSGLP